MCAKISNLAAFAAKMSEKPQQEKTRRDESRRYKDVPMTQEELDFLYDQVVEELGRNKHVLCDKRTNVKPKTRIYFEQQREFLLSLREKLQWHRELK